jgi:glutaminase
MNLVQQFPDISEKLRSKNEKSYRNFRSANVKQSSGYIEDEAVVQYYEGEFRRCHIKFLSIVVATFAVIYVILLKSSWIYNLISVG